MRKVEIKPEKHDKGWLAVERVNTALFGSRLISQLKN